MIVFFPDEVNKIEEMHAPPIIVKTMTYDRGRISDTDKMYNTIIKDITYNKSNDRNILGEYVGNITFADAQTCSLFFLFLSRMLNKRVNTAPDNIIKQYDNENLLIKYRYKLTIATITTKTIVHCFPYL